MSWMASWLETVAGAVAAVRSRAARRHDDMPGERSRLVLAGLLPLLAFALQYALADARDPAGFRFFYPAVFLSAWIGGRALGFAATAFAACSIAGALGVAGAPADLPASPRDLLDLVWFVAIGTLFAALQPQLVGRGSSSRVVRSLARTERRWRAALEVARLGVWDWDVVRGTVYHSARYREILGGRSGALDLTAAAALEEVTAEDQPHVRAALAPLITGQQRRAELELRLRHRDGRDLRVVARAVVVATDATGRASRVAGMIEDVSGRAAEADALRSLHGRLAQAIDAADRARFDGERAQQDALVATRAKSAFLATVSHELRTPLNAVIGFSTLLLSEAAGPLTDEQRKQLKLILDAGEQQLELVVDLLDFVRLEAGRLALDTTVFDLRDVLDETCGRHAPLASEQSLEFGYLRSQSPLPVLADPARVRQVLRHLLSNAVKFTERGRIEVRTTAGREHVRLEVRDTGPGITPAQQARLFHAFERFALGAGARAVTEGTVLGLALCRDLVEAMGGNIGVDSHPPQGSTFWFTLPRPPGMHSPVRAAPSADARSDITRA